MPQRRYQPPNKRADEALPRDTVCTILTRQSTVRQGTHHVFSAEKHPEELQQEARHLGFADDHISVLDWDMGIGAYNTTIEERPALHHWLHELLPQGLSRVVLVSQEDRLFRDRTEIQVARFIEQVYQHGGWVICGSRIYNFQRDLDREQFRMVCKYGRQYIEFHVKGRLHPAVQRAAMQGRYAGGPVAWGYIVDYTERSATYKHLVKYAPHAVLVDQDIFHYFANLAYPSVRAVAKHWAQDNLVWSFFPAEVNERGVPWLDTHCRRDEARGGYRFSEDIARYTLTNVAYLGWRVRSGEIAWNATHDAPLLCHEPLLDGELFWWCYDRIEDERPAWAPAKAYTLVQKRFRHSPRQTTATTDVSFLLHGTLRCANHGRRYSPQSNGKRVHCAYDAAAYEPPDCPVTSIPALDEAVVDALLARLQFDARDEAALARAAHARDIGYGEQVARVQRQLAERQAAYERAKTAIVQAPDLAEDLLDVLRRAKQGVHEAEARLGELETGVTLAAEAQQQAHRAMQWGERIRTTFREWGRAYQAKVVHLALEDAILGRVSKHITGLVLTWRGGAIDKHELVGRCGEWVEWTEAELVALRQYYEQLSWHALAQMLPGRTPGAIERKAALLGLRRSRQAAIGTVPAVVIALPETVNRMVNYGFPLGTPTACMSTDES